MIKNRKLRERIYHFFELFFIFFSFLLILSFLLNSIDYFNIISRSLFFSFVYFFLLFINEKLSKYFPFKFFLLSLILVLLVHFLSSYENLKFFDFIFGIEEFSNKILEDKFKFSNFIFQPLFYQRYKTAEENFEEKLKEFNESIEYLEFKIHENVNKLRSNFNLSTLSFNYKLREIARFHSKDMAENNYFDHINRKGEGLSDRFKLFNFTCKIIVENYIYEGAENLFLGSIYKGYVYEKLTGKIISYDFYDLDEFAHDVVNSWYNSVGHRENLLFRYWRDEGVGIFINKEGKIYVTQIFC